MRISHSHRFIFFSNPKTGSRTVRRILDPYAQVHGRPAHDLTEDFPFYTHMRPVDLRPLMEARGWDFDGYFKFLLVRNPWARMVSLFSAVSFRNGRLRWRLTPLWLRRRAFREWLPTVEPDGRGAADPDIEQSLRRFGAYTFLGYAADRSGNVLVDSAVRLEDLEARLPPLLEGLGIPSPSPLPHVGRGRYSGNYRDYYDPESRDLVARYYRDDIERFGYDF